MAVGFGAVDGVQDTIESTTLNEIDRARASLRGIGCSHCKECGDTIPIARRQAMPSAVYCIDCQGDHDGSTVSYYNRRGSKDSQLR